MHAVVDFTKTRSKLISGITQSTTSCFAVQFELVSKETLYNTLSLLSNENRKRESSYQKRRVLGESAWQVAISCQVSFQFYGKPSLPKAYRLVNTGPNGFQYHRV